MKKFSIKLMAITVTAAILCSLLPHIGLAVEEGETTRPDVSDYTINSYMAEKLNGLFDFVYGDTPYFTVSGHTGCDKISFTCDQCKISTVLAGHPLLSTYGVVVPDNDPTVGSGAFARFAVAYIFGYYLKQSELSNYGNATTLMRRIGRVAASSAGLDGTGYDEVTVDNLKSFLKDGAFGDWLQARGGSGFHSMILLSADENGVTVMHLLDNAVSDADKSRVVVSSYTYEEMLELWPSLIALMRIEEPYYSDALNKGEIVHDDHVYTDETGDTCTVCKKDFLPERSDLGAGAYTAVKGTSVFNGYYRSTGAKETVKSGASVNVCGSLVNSLGKTFYISADGGYLDADDFVLATNGPTITPDSYPSGALLFGRSYRLSGTVSDNDGLRYIWGYLIAADGTIAQYRKYSVTSPASLASTVNKNLIFGDLPLGEYTYLVVAESADAAKSRSFFKSTFTIVEELDKVTPDAPTAPTVKSKSATSVTLNTVPGCEYRVGSGAWQTSATFTGLSPATKYTFYQRYAETDTAYASAASAGLSVTTNKSSSGTAPTPAVAERAATSVTLVKVSGCEYRLAGGSWQSSAVFDGLTPGSTYTFYQRYAETSTSLAGGESDGLTVTLAKLSSTATPVKPEKSSASAESVTLKTVTGYEYRIAGGSWQSSPTFDGLEPGKTYTFYQRIAETATTLASATSAGVTIRTDKRTVAAPAAPSVERVTATSVTFKTVAGCEYRMSGGSWQSSPTFEGLSYATSYTFYMRYAETDSAYASEKSAGQKVKTDKGAGKNAPAVTIYKKEERIVTLVAVSGMEYSIDGENWQSSPVFTVENYGEYGFFQRYAETETTYAGPTSEKCTVGVYPQKLTSNEHTITQVGEYNVVSAAETGMLSEILAGIAQSEYVTVCDADGKAVSNDHAASTGMRLILPGGEEYLLIVEGDLNGDGVRDIFDLVLTRADILYGTLEGIYERAADLNGDNIVDIFDYVLLQNIIIKEN